MLNAVFPQTVILGKDISARTHSYAQRIEDELRAAGIEGATWHNVSSHQARATWDLLELISPSSLPTILPGYLQWLWEYEEADVMNLALPRLLETVLVEHAQPFSLAQLEGLSSFLSAVLEHNEFLFSEEEAGLYADTIHSITTVIHKINGKAPSELGSDGLKDDSSMAMSVVYATVNGRLVQENRGGIVTRYVADTLGSVIQTRDASGNQTSSTTYWPFGEVRASSGTNPSPWGFCGTLGYFKDAVSRFYVRMRTLRADLSRWMTVDPLWPGQKPYQYVEDAPLVDTDPSGLGPPPTLGQCKARGGKACFHCANYVFSKRNYCPKAACQAANQLCGTNVTCGPCGLCPTPAVPTSCFDRAAIEKFGEFLRGSGAAGKGGYDCSASCGGYGNGDKLAHCFKGCAIAICIGATCGMIGKDDDPEDNDAEWTGYWIGYTQVNVGSGAYVLRQCLEKCGDAVSGMTCH